MSSQEHEACLSPFAVAMGKAWPWEKTWPGEKSPREKRGHVVADFAGWMKGTFLRPRLVNRVNRQSEMIPLGSCRIRKVCSFGYWPWCVDFHLGIGGGSPRRLGLAS